MLQGEIHKKKRGTKERKREEEREREKCTRQRKAGVRRFNELLLERDRVEEKTVNSQPGASDCSLFSSDSSLSFPFRLCTDP